MKQSPKKEIIDQSVNQYLFFLSIIMVLTSSCSQTKPLNRMLTTRRLTSFTKPIKPISNRLTNQSLCHEYMTTRFKRGKWKQYGRYSQYLRYLSVSTMLCGSGVKLKEESKGEKIRPIYDEIGYAWTPEQNEAITNYLDQNYTIHSSNLRNPVGGIFAHNDELFTRRYNTQFFNQVKAKEIVAFGVTHRFSNIGRRKDIIVMEDFDQWTGPYGLVHMSPLRDKILSERDEECMILNSEAHSKEHSIEAFIPTFQSVNREFLLTPILISRMSLEAMDSVSEKLSDIIVDYIKKNNLTPGKDIFFLCSNDCSHYGSDFDNTFYGEGVEGHTKVVAADLKAIENHLIGEMDESKIRNFRKEGVVDRGWCGRHSVSFGMLVVIKVFRKLNHSKVVGEFLGYSNSLTSGVLPIKGVHLGITGPYNLNHSVGHGWVLYYNN